MAALMGFMLGFPDILVAIMLAVISRGLVAFATLVAKKKDKRQPIAFGPFLAVGTMAAFLWADPLLEWYLGLFGI
jgi:leader peptidase (prepilin peptidase)/N-methyltransferase